MGLRLLDYSRWGEQRNERYNRTTARGSCFSKLNQFTSEISLLAKNVELEDILIRTGATNVRDIIVGIIILGSTTGCRVG